MQELNDIRDQISYLERDKIAKLESNLHKTNLKLERNNALTERNTEVMEKFSETLNSMQLSMIKISSSIEQTSKFNEALSTDIKDVKHEIIKVNKRVDEVDDKTKVDVARGFTNWISANWFKLLMTGGGLAYLVDYLVTK